MKKNYVKPCIMIEEFVANEYISVCGQGSGQGGSELYKANIACYDHQWLHDKCLNPSSHVVILKKGSGNGEYEIVDFLVDGQSHDMLNGKKFSWYVTVSWKEDIDYQKSVETHNANLGTNIIQPMSGGSSGNRS